MLFPGFWRCCGDSHHVSTDEQIWQEQAIGSMYSYFRASRLASASQFLNITVALLRPAWTQTGWWDFLNGNFQSEISLESHRPQHALTVIVSLQESLLASDSVLRRQLIWAGKFFIINLTNNSISVEPLVTSDGRLCRSLNKRRNHFRCEADGD